MSGPTPPLAIAAPSARPRTPSTRRLATRAAAWALLGTLGACDQASSGASLAPEQVRASLGVQATVLASSATAVSIRAGFRNASNQRVEIGAKDVALSASPSQRETMQVDLTRCLAEAAQRSDGACPVELQLVLLRGATPLDQRTTHVSVKPGESVTAGPVSLYEVQTVQVTTPAAGGGSGAPVTSMSVEAGDTLRFDATPVDATGAPVTGRTLQWSSSNTGIATVDANTGLVTARAAGTVTIQISGGGPTPTQIALTVVPPSVRALSVSPTSLAMFVGDSRQLAVTARDARNNVLTGKTIAYSSNNVAVATVGTDGTVRAIAAGSAAVTASSREGPNGSTVTTTIPVTVTLPPIAVLAASPTSVQLSAGTQTTVTVTARDAAGNAMPGRPTAITVGGYDNTLVRVTPSSGPGPFTLTVFGIAAGPTHILVQASEGPNSNVVVLTIPVTVTNPAVLVATPTTATFAVKSGTGNPQPIDLAIGSSVPASAFTGLTSAVTYKSGPTGWLAASLLQTTTPTTLHLAATVGALSTGIYSATVKITASSGASINVPVTLTVTAATPVDCSRSTQSPDFPPTSGVFFANPNGVDVTGGAGSYFIPVALGTQPQAIRVDYDMYTIPDALTVCFRGVPLYDTGGFVSGTGSFSFAYPGSSGTAASKTDPTQSMYVYLAVRGSDPSTSWDILVYGDYVAPSYSVPIRMPSVVWPAGQHPFDPPYRQPARHP